MLVMDGGHIGHLLGVRRVAVCSFHHVSVPSLHVPWCMFPSPAGGPPPSVCAAPSELEPSSLPTTATRYRDIAMSDYPIWDPTRSIERHPLRWSPVRAWKIPPPRSSPLADRFVDDPRGRSSLVFPMSVRFLAGSEHIGRRCRWDRMIYTRWRGDVVRRRSWRFLGWRWGRSCSRHCWLNNVLLPVVLSVHIWLSCLLHSQPTVHLGPLV